MCGEWGQRGDGVTYLHRIVHDSSTIVVEFGQRRHLAAYYGYRVNRIWIHNWALASSVELEWFCVAVLCRIEEGGEICFVGWDGSIVTWVPYR